jgi:hypothetical protein
MLVKLIFEMIHLDNMKVLKALICPRDDVQPLVDGSTKRRVGFSELNYDRSSLSLLLLEHIYTYN